MFRKLTHMMILLVSVGLIFACGKTDEMQQNANPQEVVNTYLAAWKNRDWKTMYRFTKSSFIQELRKADPASPLSDEELFARELARGASKNQFYDLKSYEILNIPILRKASQKSSVEVRLNGQDKRLPLVFEGLSLKIDLGAIN